MPGRLALGAAPEARPGQVVVDRKGNIYLYDPYDAILGTMGFNPFKLIGNAVGTAAGFVRRVISRPDVRRAAQQEVVAAVTPAYDSLPETVKKDVELQVMRQRAGQVGGQLMAGIGGLPGWVLPVGIGALALLVLRGRRR